MGSAKIGERKRPVAIIQGDTHLGEQPIELVDKLIDDDPLRWLAGAFCHGWKCLVSGSTRWGEDL